MSSKDPYYQLLSFLDLTSLESTDNRNTLAVLLQKANKGYDNYRVAAVCVYPNFGNFVAEGLNPEIKTAVVAGYFPSGQTLTSAKVDEIAALENSSVNEIDIVINRGEFLAGNYDFVREEISLMRKAAPSKLFKVILETGELKTQELIRNASELAINAGADFIKTSTGKIAAGATPEAVKTMCEVIQSHFLKTGKKIGIKPSGGIRTIDDALHYREIVLDILGHEWMNPDLFRIGASSLYDALVKKLDDGD